MKNYLTPLAPSTSYHIYNRAVGKEKLFTSDDNYYYFLNQYQKYIQPVAETFCYCLLPNHFHFIIKIRNEIDLIKRLTKLRTLSGLEIEEILSTAISREFSHLFNSYTQAFNKQKDRNGGLFSRPFKRIRITDEKYLRKLVHYIHYNPVEAGLCDHPEEWKYSSYNKIASKQFSSIVLNPETVIEWFGDLDNFIHFHKLTSSISPTTLTGF